jgi:hypothetical protein
MTFSKRHLAIALLLPAFCALPARGAEPATQPIDDAIAHLGDADPAVREQASKVLRDAGPAARAALEEAAKGDDPEVAARARDILRAAPAAPATRNAEPDEDLPEIRQYRSATRQGKRLVIRRHGTTPDGLRALTKLWGIETDAELRSDIFNELLKQWSTAASILLADGSPTSAELLLNTAVDRKLPESARAYAVYWRVRGRLDETIRRWAPLGGKQPADTWAEQVLAILYRAKGDAGAAVAHAAACEDPAVLSETLLWAGEWARLSTELHRNIAARQNTHDLGFLTGLDALAGDETALAADMVKLTALVNTEQEAHAVADTLLLVNHPDEATKILLDAKQYCSVYELLDDRGRFDDAEALVAAHDKDMSAEDMTLRAAAAKEYARLGLKKQCREMIDRVAKENADSKFSRVFVYLAEAERDIGMTEKAWGHFADAIENSGDYGGGYWNISHAFPAKENGVEWWRLWFAIYNQNRQAPIPLRDMFNQMRKEYDGTMPLDELKTIVKEAIDLAAQPLDPYVKLAWEAALRMKKEGHEEDAVKWIEELAPHAAGCELLINLGDWAAEKKDWALAADRYAMACRKDRGSALAMYLQGWAMEHGGQIAAGRDRMQLARLLPLANDKQREDMMSGLLWRRLEDAAIREADLLIRTADPLSGSCEVALRAAAERADDRGEGAVAHALWQRTLTNFLNGTYSFRFEPYYLHLPEMVRRAHARALIAGGDWAGAQRDIKVSMEMLPIDGGIAIDLVPDLDKLGKRAEANALFDRVIAIKHAVCERYPDSAWHHNECAWIAAKCDRELDKALMHGKRSVELDPTNAAAIDTLAEVHFHLGHFKEAVDLEKKCVELSGGLPIHRKQLERFEAGGKQ